MPLAPRALRSRVGLHARSLGRRRQGLRRRIDGDDVFVEARPDGDEVARWQRRLRDGLEESLSLVIAKSVLALLELGVARPRSCAPVSTSARRTAPRDGARASRCSSRWRTSSTSSIRTSRRPRSSTRSCSSRATPRSNRPASRSPPRHRRRCRRTAVAVVPTLHRHPLERRRRARTRNRFAEGSRSADRRDDDAHRRHRPRVRRRRPHARLHEQGVRSGRARRFRLGVDGAPHARRPDRALVAERRERRVAASARPRRARRARERATRQCARCRTRASR